jgi:hypothetical protein
VSHPDDPSFASPHLQHRKAVLRIELVDLEQEEHAARAQIHDHQSGESEAIEAGTSLARTALTARCAIGWEGTGIGDCQDDV